MYRSKRRMQGGSGRGRDREKVTDSVESETDDLAGNEVTVQIRLDGSFLCIYAFESSAGSAA